MAQVVASTVLRNHLADVLKEIQKKDYLLVAKKGNLVSVLVNLDFFEDLLALTNKKYLKGIERARKDYREGKVFTHEEIFGKL